MRPGAAGPDPPDLFGELPGLGEPLGPLDHPLGEDDHAAGLVASGRRAWVRDPDGHGLEVWAGALRVASRLGVRGARTLHRVETPLGAERRLAVGTAEVVERVVAAHDAPVVWIDWSLAAGHGPVDLKLEWRVPMDHPANPGGAVSWRALPRGLTVSRRFRVPAPPGSASPGPEDPRGPARAGSNGAEHRVLFAFSGTLQGLHVDPADSAPRASARVPCGDDGARLAVVCAGPDDDLSRLLRIAGRTRVAVPAREAGVAKVLGRGLTVTAPEPLARAVARARLGLARSVAHLDGAAWPAAAGPYGDGRAPGRWRRLEATRAALALLAAGELAPVRSFLRTSVDLAVDGRVPDGGVGAHDLSYDDPLANPLYLLLLARYLAWSGARADVRGQWDAAMEVVDACVAEPPRDGHSPATAARAAALAALAVTAEEVGDAGGAARLRDAAETAGRGRAAGHAAGPPAPWDPAAAPAGSPPSVVGHLVHGVLGAEPDAPRGRLVLRPRPSMDQPELEVRGLTVGTATVAVDYRREGATHRLAVRQLRGGTPLQVVLEPELPGGVVATTRIDGEPVRLDPRPVGDRWRVPVQVVLDHPRSLEVEFAADPA